MEYWRKIRMAKTWQITTDDCSMVFLLQGSGQSPSNGIWLENTWHEVSPTQAATLPSGTKMLDANNKELTLLDGYCTTYFYKGWQTYYSMVNGKIGDIINNKNGSYRISDTVGPTVADIEITVDFKGRYLQIVRLPDGKVGLPDNVGQNLISDLYPGIMWGAKRNNWYNQWGITPLAPANFSISDQTTDLPRSFSIDETNIPGYGTGTNKEFYAPELFAPYMYLRKQDTKNGIYVGGIIVVIGVKKLS